ncbi:MAG: RNA polymerase sigma factor RpoE [Armatimonadaceae bacterium]
MAEKHRTAAMESATDEQLVMEALLGNIRAFDELVRRYRAAAVLSAEQVLGSRSVAEEVAQEAFLLAFKALPQLEEPAKFGSWLRRIARNRAQRVAEREWRTASTEDSELDLLIRDRSEELHRIDPVRITLAQEEMDLLWVAMERLPCDWREALYLRCVEGWSLEQIAAYLSVSVGVVRGRLDRARALMKKNLPSFAESSK